LSAASRLALAAPPPSGAPDDVLALTEAYNASGRQLFGEFAKKPGNIVFSPYSIGTVMAMALSGARGATEQEMAKVLRHSLTRAKMELASEETIAILNETCAAAGQADETKCADPRQRSSNHLLVADALMLPPTLGKFVSPNYIALLKDRYAAEVFKDATLKQINGWVSEKTEGKIPSLFNSFPAESVLVLINAIYFKAAWSFPFRKLSTTDGDFTTASNTRVSAPMMHKREKFRWLKQPGYRAIRLPFAGLALGLIVVLPDATDGLDAVARGLDYERQVQLFEAIARRDEEPVALSLPKFKASFEGDLIGPFSDIGLKLALSDKADFSGIADRQVNIGGIVHKAVIELAEEGVEAAAATAITVQTTSAPEQRPSEPFVVDRPFLFFVVDNRTGAVLFAGRIVDPTKAA